MSEYNLYSNFLEQGYWWLPNNPGLKIPGDLKYSPKEGATLELNGAFNQLGQPRNTPSIINGVTSKGKEITLSNCLSLGFSMSFPGYQTEKYFAHQLIYGYHFVSLR